MVIKKRLHYNFKVYINSGILCWILSLLRVGVKSIWKYEDGWMNIEVIFFHILFKGIKIHMRIIKIIIKVEILSSFFAVVFVVTKPKYFIVLWYLCIPCRSYLLFLTLPFCFNIYEEFTLLLDEFLFPLYVLYILYTLIFVHICHCSKLNIYI